jgi:hypothetical protein
MGNKAPGVKYAKAFEFFGRRSGREPLFETITAYGGGRHDLAPELKWYFCIRYLYTKNAFIIHRHLDVDWSSPETVVLSLPEADQKTRHKQVVTNRLVDCELPVPQYPLSWIDRALP